MNSIYVVDDMMSFLPPPSHEAGYRMFWVWATFFAEEWFADHEVLEGVHRHEVHGFLGPHGPTWVMDTLRGNSLKKRHFPPIKKEK